MKIIKFKKGMEMEYSVKAILALIVLVVLIGLFIMFVVNRSGGSLNTIVDETNDQGDGMLDGFRNLFGSKCENGQTKCSLTGVLLECNDNKWEKTDDICDNE